MSVFVCAADESADQNPLGKFVKVTAVLVLLEFGLLSFVNAALDDIV